VPPEEARGILAREKRRLTSPTLRKSGNTKRRVQRKERCVRSADFAVVKAEEVVPEDPTKRGESGGKKGIDCGIRGANPHAVQKNHQNPHDSPRTFADLLSA
jgi:hypothetical protein